MKELGPQMFEFEERSISHRLINNLNIHLSIGIFDFSVKIVVVLIQNVVWTTIL